MSNARRPFIYAEPCPPRNANEQIPIGRLIGLTRERRSDITNRAALDRNFPKKIEALSRVYLTVAGFARLLGELVTRDTFLAAKTLRQINPFTCDDGAPLSPAGKITAIPIQEDGRNAVRFHTNVQMN